VVLQRDKVLQQVRKQLATRSWLSSPRYFIWLIRALRDQRQSAVIAADLGFGFLDIENFRLSKDKKSETLFILGSGSSVNELSENQFSHIAKHVSIGINLWVAHDFVPDAYSFEAGGFPPLENEIPQMLQMGRELARPEVLLREPKVLLLRPNSPSRTSQFLPIPEALTAHTFVYGRSNVPELQIQIAERGTRDFLRSYLRFRAPRHALPDNGASVVRMIFLALALGFQKIVLAGIDLNRSSYFWYSDGAITSRPELSSIFPRPVGEHHGTTETVKRPHDTKALIVWIRRALRDFTGAQLYVASSSSSLAKDLTLYPWEDLEN